MPTWSGILAELNESEPPDFDGVLLKYLNGLYRHTGRNAILYASGWLTADGKAPLESVVVNDDDLQSFMDVGQGLRGGALDLILHSPGGSPEAAEAIISYLRTRFDNIRVIVPHLAMSAATMIACAADQVVLGKHSFLGPAGPQFVLDTPLGTRMAAAGAILEQCKRIKREVEEDPATLPAWTPILRQYGGGLLARCETALDMSRELTREWLRSYMFKHRKNPLEQAEKVSGWLTDQDKFKSHNRRIKRSVIEALGLSVVRLEDDPKLQDLALSAFHTTSHAFVHAGVAKVVASQDGCAVTKKPGRGASPQHQPRQAGMATF